MKPVRHSVVPDTNIVIEQLAEQLHIWYLEACQQPEANVDFNPNAQKSYDALSEGSKFLDRYIAGKLTQHHQDELRKVVERKRNKIVSSLSERKAYNQALDDILTLIDELFIDKTDTK